MNVTYKPLSRRKVIGLGASAAVAATAGGLVGYHILHRPRPRNVIFIIADALRPDRLGCYGRPRQNGIDISPNIDRLAQEGVLFDKCLAQSSWTLPSAASYMTSREPFVEGELYNEGFVTGRCRTIAEILRERGWATMAIIENPYLYIPGKSGERELVSVRGFESFRHGSPRLAPNPLYDEGIGQKEVFASFTNAQEATNSAIELLSRRVGRTRPFFMYLHYMDTHEPYNPPEAYKELASRAPAVGGMPDYMLYQAIRTEAKRRGDELLRAEDMPAFERASALYDAAISFLDEWVGTLVNFLKASGLWENTLIVFSSDHGEEFNEHGWIGHSKTLYEESISVPLIAAGRGVARGARVHSPVSMLDIAPTILDSCGIDEPGEMQGRALDLAGVETEPPLATISTLVRPDVPVPLYAKKYAVTHRLGRKLIRTDFLGERAGEPTKIELFDLTADHQEQSDVSSTERDDVEALASILNRHKEQAASTAAAPFTLDEEARRVLESLGYLH